jgi:hypothetical protein
MRTQRAAARWIYKGQQPSDQGRLSPSGFLNINVTMIQAKFVCQQPQHGTVDHTILVEKIMTMSDDS